MIVSPLPDGKLYIYYNKNFLCSDGKTYQSLSDSRVLGRYDTWADTFSSGDVTGKLIDRNTLSVRVRTTIPAPKKNISAICELDWTVTATLKGTGKDAVVREFIELYKSRTLSPAQALDVMFEQCRRFTRKDCNLP